MSYDPSNFSFLGGRPPGQPVPPQQQGQMPNLTPAQAQQLAMARAQNLGAGGAPGAVPNAQLQAMLQMQQMAQQQQPFQTAPQQQQQAGGLSLSNVQEMLRNGQLAPEQFNALAQQIAALQAQRNAQQNRPGPIQPPPQRPPSQQAQHQFFPSQPPAAPQQPTASPSIPTVPLGGTNTDEQGRIPVHILSQYMESMHRARSMQQRITIITNALQTGYLPGGQDGTPAKPIPPEQKAAFESQLNDTRRSWQALMAHITSFQTHWTTAKITADWQSHALESHTKQRAAQGAQGQPNQPQGQGQGQAPNQAQAQAQAQQQQAQLQLQAQLQQQAAAQQSAAQANQQQQQQQAAQQAAAAQFNFGQPANANSNSTANPLALQAQLLQQARAAKAAQQNQPAPQVFPQPPPVPAVQQLGAQPLQPGKAVMPPLHLLQTTLDPKQFMQSLFELMRKRGEPITGTPYIEGREVDLYKLYQCVAMAGGSAKINASNAWHHIAKQLGWELDVENPNSPETSKLSNELARTYASLLKPYEEIWAKSMAKQRQQILEAAQRMNAPSPSTNKDDLAAMQARLAAAQQQQQQQQQMQLQAQFQQQQAAQQQQNAALPQLPPPQANNAFANLTPQQLMSYGFNATQVQHMQAQQQADASANAGLAASAATSGDIKPPPPPQRQNSMSNLKPQTTEPTMEQMTEARNIVNQLRMSVEQSRPKVKPVEIPPEERTKIATMTHQLVPLVKKVLEILPLFLAMTGTRDDVKKIITFAALFNDQIRMINLEQFALDMQGLETLRGQFERCWNYVKLNHKATRPPASADPTQAPPGMTKDQFSLMAQKNAALRVEDLKPPPVKRRRGTSNSTTSPAAFPSPSTPQTDVESPPKSGATPRGTRAPPKGRGKKAIDAASPPIKTESPRNIAPSPASLPLPLPIVAEEPQESQSQKRKREAEEAAADPDGFIERTLRTFTAPTRSDSGQLLVQDLTSHLPFDFNPLLPPELGSEKGLTFIGGDRSGASSSIFANAALAPIPPPPVDSQSTWIQDFYIDSSAAGFDLDDGKTPELASDKPDEASPPSDDEQDLDHRRQGEATQPISTSKPLSTPLLYAPLGAGGMGSGGEEPIDLDAWLNGDAASSEPLPPTFAWSGALPEGSWRVYAEQV